MAKKRTSINTNDLRSFTTFHYQTADGRDVAKVTSNNRPDEPVNIRIYDMSQFPEMEKLLSLAQPVTTPHQKYKYSPSSSSSSSPRKYKKRASPAIAHALHLARTIQLNKNKGLSDLKIAKVLNTAGKRTVRGSKWTTSNVTLARKYIEKYG